MLSDDILSKSKPNVLRWSEHLFSRTDFSSRKSEAKGEKSWSKYGFNAQLGKLLTDKRETQETVGLLLHAFKTLKKVKMKCTRISCYLCFIRLCSCGLFCSLHSNEEKRGARESAGVEGLCNGVT